MEENIIHIGDECIMPKASDCKTKYGEAGYFHGGQNKGGVHVRITNVFTDDGNENVSVRGAGFGYTMLAEEMIPLGKEKMIEEYSLTF